MMEYDLKMKDPNFDENIMMKIFLRKCDLNEKQAGAELGQAQPQLGLEVRI